MRKDVATLILMASTASLVYRFFDAEGFHFYAEDHRHLFLLVGIVALSAALGIAYQALSAAWKHNVALWFMGSLAT